MANMPPSTVPGIPTPDGPHRASPEVARPARWPLRIGAPAAVLLFGAAIVFSLGSGLFIVPAEEDRQEENWGAHAWAHLMQAVLCGALALHLHLTHAIRRGDLLARTGFVLLVWGTVVYFFDSYATAMFGDVTSWTHSLWLQGPMQLPVNIGLPLVGAALGVRTWVRRAGRSTDAGPVPSTRSQ